MSDNPNPEGGKPEGADQAKPDDKPFKAPESQADLDRIIEQRLARERQRYADYDSLKEKAGKYEQLEDEKKTEAQRLAEDRDGHKSRAEKAEAELMRLQVGLDKGLTPAQAKRLTGSTKEELEADADELIATFGGSNKEPEGKPTPRLRGGGDPEEEPDEDLSKILDDVPRS